MLSYCHSCCLPACQGETNYILQLEREKTHCHKLIYKIPITKIPCHLMVLADHWMLRYWKGGSEMAFGLPLALLSVSVFSRKLPRGQKTFQTMEHVGTIGLFSCCPYQGFFRRLFWRMAKCPVLFLLQSRRARSKTCLGCLNAPRRCGFLKLFAANRGQFVATSNVGKSSPWVFRLVASQGWGIPSNFGQ